jgi:cytochrome c5
MRRPHISGRLVAAVALVLATPVLAADDEGNVQLKEGPGKDLTSGRCVICHSLEYIPSNAPAMDRAAWQKTVQKMRERFGAPISDEEAKSILDYLSATYAGKS